VEEEGGRGGGAQTILIEILTAILGEHNIFLTKNDRRFYLAQ